MPCIPRTRQMTSTSVNGYRLGRGTLYHLAALCIRLFSTSAGHKQPSRRRLRRGHVCGCHSGAGCARGPRVSPRYIYDLSPHLRGSLRPIRITYGAICETTTVNDGPLPSTLTPSALPIRYNPDTASEYCKRCLAASARMRTRIACRLSEAATCISRLRRKESLPQSDSQPDLPTLLQFQQR
ncbi:hypothetical protein VTI74DRAFT_5420 [Chaetomium olivicolor]